MVTIINNPPASNNSSDPIEIIILLIVLVVVGYLVYIYGLPTAQHMQGGTPQISVPSKIDVNIKQTK